MMRKRLYAKQTASVEYEQIDLLNLLEGGQRWVDRMAEQVRGYGIVVDHATMQRLRVRGADDETITAVAAEYRENRFRGLGWRNARTTVENKLGIGAATPGETTPQPMVKRFTQPSGTESNAEERNNDERDDMDRPATQDALREEPQGDGAASGDAFGAVQQVGAAVQDVHPQQPARDLEHVHQLVDG